jgi:valyl-tRNA synthetase
VKGWEIDKKQKQPESAKIAIQWYRAKFQKSLKEIEKSFSLYRISEALMTIYKLIWDDYSSWFLEMVKPGYQQPIDSKTYAEIIGFLEDNLKILHPFMPFITEHIWQHITDRSTDEALIISHEPKKQPFDENLIEEFKSVAELISNIRSIRKEKNISFKNELELVVLGTNDSVKDFESVIRKLCNVSSISYVEEKISGALSFRVKSTEYFIPMATAIDVKAEKAKIEEELKYTEGFLISIQKKLSNERFVNNAPEQVVANERKKEADAIEKIKTLKLSLTNL